MILVPLKFGEPWRISWAEDDTSARVTFCDERTLEPATVTSTQAGGSVGNGVQVGHGSITINHESPVNALFIFILKTFKTGFFSLVLAMDLKQPESSVSQQFFGKKRFTQIHFDAF